MRGPPFLVHRDPFEPSPRHCLGLAYLKQGDRVVTTGGMYGTVVGLKEGVAVLKIADQVKVEVAKNAITGVVAKSREA